MNSATNAFTIKSQIRNLSKKFQIQSITESDISFQYMEARSVQTSTHQKHWWSALNEHLKSVLRKDYERYCKTKELF